MRITLKALVVAIVTMAVVTGGAFGAKKLIINGGNVKNSSLTGSDIKNGSITNSDIRKGTVKLDKLSSGTQKLIRAVGKTGPQGPQGPAGGAGSSVVGEHWGIIDRNTVGSAVGELRNGPYSRTTAGAVSAPPFGKGSLDLRVRADEKVDFGNEIDFTGNPVSGLANVAYRVFQTGEDISVGGATNLPNITIEINPQVTGTTDDYTSAVFVPAALPANTANQWSARIDATDATKGSWYLTGGEGTTVGCTAAAPCSFADLKTKIAAAHLAADPAASIISVGVAKGTDNRFEGAVDGLQINNQVFDFESYGVVTTAP